MIIKLFPTCGVKDGPSFDPERGGALRFLEVRLAVAGAGGESPWQEVGSYELTAGGTSGSKLDLALLRAPGKQLLFRITGTAHYEDGSYSDLVSFESADRTITITPQRLKGGPQRHLDEKYLYAASPYRGVGRDPAQAAHRLQSSAGLGSATGRDQSGSDRAMVITRRDSSLA